MFSRLSSNGSIVSGSFRPETVRVLLVSLKVISWFLRKVSSALTVRVTVSPLDSPVCGVTV